MQARPSRTNKLTTAITRTTPQVPLTRQIIRVAPDEAYGFFKIGDVPLFSECQPHCPGISRAAGASAAGTSQRILTSRHSGPYDNAMLGTKKFDTQLHTATGDGGWWNGDEVAAAVSAKGLPYLFTGREFDALDGADSNYLQLQYSRARYYSYPLRRWLSRDPIGYADGMNLYQYVGSNPINYVDPSGLASACCDKCPTEGKIKDAMIAGIVFTPVGHTPGGMKSIEKGLKWVGKYSAIGGKGAKSIGKIVRAWAQAVIFNIHVKIEFKKCESKRCWIFWKQRDWRDKSEHYECTAKSDMPMGNLGDFSTTSSERQKKRILKECINAAKKKYGIK